MSNKIRLGQEFNVSKRGIDWVFTSYKSISILFKPNDASRFVPIFKTVGAGLYQIPELPGVIKIEREGTDVGELRLINVTK